ncbi:DUF86 domain-containing protein [Gloeocapsa sp. PCC 73106]|uniref:HepT-like ribonuclease domain-containing protein n=1 Tax=Gloeocapsa sp. PCC 73106 TaxID=102232 RepID=UPI0002ABAAA1|nr:HepT-like ribonuclease domain-containing protein [Gloeocapsa sp. PCC 73106]ELS00239.1 hypothetical protein GLO73106DRAFT_00040950 [Gloeocapsa sp. PCC 73106]
MTSDEAYLKYILECLEKIEAYSRGGKEEFINNSMVQDAILRRLQTLAESTQRLSRDLKGGVAEVDWRNISGFRNILVHNYLGGIDLDVVWNVIENYLPDLKNQIQTLLLKFK